MIPQGGDHRAVVGAQGHGGEVGFQGGILAEGSAKAAVGRYTAADHQPGDARIRRGPLHPLHEHVDDGSAEGSGDVLRGGGSIADTKLFELVHRGGFQTGAGYVVTMISLAEAGNGETEGIGSAVFGEAVQEDTSGVAHPVVFGHFVEGLAAGIIDGGAEYFNVVQGFQTAEDGVAAGNDEAEMGIGDIVFQVGGVQMGHDVIHADPGFSGGPGEALGVGEAGQEGSDEAGPGCHGQGIDVFLQAGVRITQGERGHLVDPLHVKTGGNFGHHAVPGGVAFHLTHDHVGEDVLSVAHHGDGAFIAAGFDSQDVHGG